MNPIDQKNAFALQAPASADTTPAEADPRYRARATEAAEKFESFFIADMLHQMRSATRELADQDSVFRNRIDEDMLDTADNRVAEVMAGQHAFGIADTILRQLLPTAAASSTAALKSGEQAVALPLVNRADPHQ